MKNIVRNLTLLGCVGSSAFAAPFLAIGDNAELFLTATASASYNDNVLLADSGPLDIEDEVFTFTPGFDLQFGKDSQVKGNLYGSGTFTAYSDNSDLNDQLAAIGFVANYDNGQLKLSTNASFTELNQPTVDTPTTGTLVNRDVTAAGIKGEYSFSEKTSAGLGFVYNKTDYHNTGFADLEEYTVPVNFYYELTPKVDLSAGVSYTKSKVEAPNKNEFDTVYYNVGARGSFTPKLSGSFTVGYNTRDADVGDDEDGSFGANADLSYQYSDKTVLTLAGSRNYSNAAGGASYENTQITLGASTDIAVDWKLNAAATYRVLDYDTAGRKDKYVEGSVGATYIINSNFSANASYLYRENFSDATNADFHNNVVTVSLSARY